MKRDFGPGLTIDDLIGLCAEDIQSIKLPNEEIYKHLGQAVGLLVEQDLQDYALMELWGDGHSVWQGPGRDDILLIRPTGQFVTHRL
jgi:hypothetical protein